MQIILNQEESKAYQDQIVREAILAETSKFPVNMKLPEGCKTGPEPLSTEQKAEIQKLHDTGMGRAQIARKLHLPGRQVSGVVQAYINAKKDIYVTPSPVIDYIEAHQTPEIEDLQPIKPLVMPEVEKPAIEPTCSLCGKPLDRDRTAIKGKFYCKGCAPAKVPTMITRKPKPIRSNSEIDSLIVTMSPASPIDIANEINRAYGGSWMPEDVTKRLKELRS